MTENQILTQVHEQLEVFKELQELLQENNSSIRYSKWLHIWIIESPALVSNHNLYNSKSSYGYTIKEAIENFKKML